VQLTIIHYLAYLATSIIQNFNKISTSTCKKLIYLLSHSNLSQTDFSLATADKLSPKRGSWLYYQMKKTKVHTIEILQVSIVLPISRTDQKTFLISFRYEEVPSPTSTEAKFNMRPITAQCSKPWPLSMQGHKCQDPCLAMGAWVRVRILARTII